MRYRTKWHWKQSVRFWVQVGLVIVIGVMSGIGAAEIYVQNKLAIFNCPVIRIQGDKTSGMTIDPRDPSWLIITNPLKFECASVEQYPHGYSPARTLVRGF